MDDIVIRLILGFLFSTVLTLVAGHLKRKLYYTPIDGKIGAKAFNPVIQWGLTLMFLFIFLILFYTQF